MSGTDPYPGDPQTGNARVTRSAGPRRGGSGGAARGHVSGQRGGRQQKQRSAREYGRVGGAHLVQQGAGYADRDTRAAQHQGPADHHALDTAALRAQRHADSDLVRTARHRVRNDPVDADGREKQRQ